MYPPVWTDTALFWQTNVADWLAYFTTSAFDGGVLGSVSDQPEVSAGVGSRLLTTTQPWFLKVLFLMRVVVLPTIGRLSPLPMLLVVICCWLAGYLYLTPSFFGPEGSDAIAITFYHMPSFVIGYLCQQTGLASSYISFCRRRPAAHVAIRCASAGAFVAILLLAFVGGTTLDRQLERHCYQYHWDKNHAAPQERLLDLGCASLHYLNVLLHLFATLFWLPLGEVPVISSMGRRTLMAYLLRSQVSLSLGAHAPPPWGTAPLGHRPLQSPPPSPCGRFHPCCAAIRSETKEATLVCTGDLLRRERRASHPAGCGLPAIVRRAACRRPPPHSRRHALPLVGRCSRGRLAARHPQLGLSPPLRFGRACRLAAAAPSPPWLALHALLLLLLLVRAERSRFGRPRPAVLLGPVHGQAVGSCLKFMNR